MFFGDINSHLGCIYPQTRLTDIKCKSASAKDKAYGNLTGDEQLGAIADIGQASPELESVPLDQLMGEITRRVRK